MSVVARLQRLERAEGDRHARAVAERIAERHGLTVDVVWRMVEDIGRRVARWGIDGELKRMAVEYGWTEDEVRERYAEAVRECSE